MKKITTLALVLLASQTFADTTGTLLLQGEVAEELAIVVTPEAGHDSLDLSASPTDLKVASVNEKSNSNTGYNIQVKSANAGELKNGTLDSLAYEISYDGGSFVSPTVVDQVVKTQSGGAIYDNDSDVDIKYTGKPAASMVEGVYEDTLTFTISAN
jgi:archaellin